jgi:ApaG protein
MPNMTPTTQITRGIKISVETFYQHEHSRPVEHKHIFAYRVTIENKSEHTVQLLRRYWKILDSTGAIREIEGEGVIGLQPILEPGAHHQYISWADLASDMGKMLGTYLMSRIVDQHLFQVAIPEFMLIAPAKMN